MLRITLEIVPNEDGVNVYHRRLDGTVGLLNTHNTINDAKEHMNNVLDRVERNADFLRMVEENS